MNKEYNASSIQVLEGLEAVRKRIGMYLGDNGSRGLHQSLFEVIDNALDEHLQGFGNEIKVTLYKNGSISVSDKGRGIPVEPHPEKKISTLQVVMCTLHSGGKFDNKAYSVSAGTHGVGVSATCGVSKKLVVQTVRNGKLYQQTYEKGVPVTKVEELGPTKAKGTTVTFEPDPTIFNVTTFSPKIITERLRELAYLNSNLTTTFFEEQTNKTTTYCYKGGIKELVEFLSKDQAIIHPVLFLSGNTDKIQYEVAFQYNNSEQEIIESYSNCIHTTDHGVHVSGVKRALTKSLNKFTEEYNLLPKDIELQGSDYSEGRTLVVSIKFPDPSYESQTKSKLTNPYVEGVLGSKLITEFEKLFACNADEIKKIIKQVIISAKAREAARKARESIKKKAAKKFDIISKKLADCINSGQDAELFIVEGDSAGGSAKQGRNRNFQAILPIQGKVLNVEKNTVGRLHQHKELGAIVDAIGLDLDNINLEDLRYGKVIIMTDADIDGSHIQTLLLTFFFRHLQPLITNGNLYLAQPPLFGAKIGNQRIYFYDEKDLTNKLVRECSSDTKLFIEGKDFSQFVSDVFTIDTLRLFLKNHSINIREVFKDKIQDEISIKNQKISVPKVASLLRSLPKKDLSIPLKIEVNYKGAKNSTPIIIWDLPAFIRQVWRPKVEITRYKGLGEMDPEALWETTMDPNKRILKKVVLNDIPKADQVVELLMGKEVEPRRDFIMEHALKANLDV